MLFRSGAAFLGEKRIQGSLMGSNRFPVDMPRLVDFYMSGKLKLDDMISQRIKLADVNDAFAEMKIGVGIHTGPAVVGTIGSPRRLDYTAIGDTVNTSARIESANKDRGTEILLSAATHADLPAPEQDRLQCRPVAPVPLKGKSQPLEVFQIPTPNS